MNTRYVIFTLLLCLSTPLSPVRAEVHHTGRPEIGGFDSDRAALRMLKSINTVRREHELSPLLLDERVSDLAELHSKDMIERNFYAHLSPEGFDATQRARRSGLPYFLAENIGISLCGDRDQDEVVDAFMERFLESPRHKRNILDPDITHVGLGFSRDKDLSHRKFSEMMPTGYRNGGLGGLFVTQEFFRRSLESWSPKRFPREIRRGSSLQFSGRTIKGLEEVSVAIGNDQGTISQVPTNCDGRGNFSAILRFDYPGRKRVLLLAPEDKPGNTYVTVGEFAIRVD